MEDREFFLIRLNQTLNAYKEVQKVISDYRGELVETKTSILSHVNKIDINLEDQQKEIGSNLKDANKKLDNISDRVSTNLVDANKKLDILENKINDIQVLANKMATGVNILKWTLGGVGVVITLITMLMQFGIIQISYGAVAH